MSSPAVLETLYCEKCNSWCTYSIQNLRRYCRSCGTELHFGGKNRDRYRTKDIGGLRDSWFDPNIGPHTPEDLFEAFLKMRADLGL